MLGSIKRIICTDLLLLFTPVLVAPAPARPDDPARALFPGHLCELSGVPIPGSTPHA